ncbi:M20/M25/M40 family metallo-hydrolase [Cellulosilyticum ruminicola]|uniref:M20/M25/M40 family metallo-hydrolase n=1 Tax=Cellulosilyticum ruminicola TaxID=425254 RepID=UPI002E8DFF2F|nr:M20/M25/M40 family metallo-hydrolase [Cellulosilyticum ruminicola]
MLLLMAKYVTLSKLKPNCGILFVANSGEEGLGNLKGCKQLIKDYGKRIREVISFDCTYNTLCQKAVGSSRYKITIRTEGGHSFQDFGNRNAIYYLSSLITKLYDIAIPKVGESQTTYNVGVIEGGTSVNTIAQNASVLYEYRSDTHECLKIMKNNFTTVINNYRAKGLDIEIEELGTRPCMQHTNIALQSALTKKCEALLTYYTGHKPQLVSASTDCNIPFSLGIPTVCFGLYEGAGAHTRDEWIDISSLTTGFHLAAGLILQYFDPNL